jgi:hypothetical protein
MRRQSRPQALFGQDASESAPLANGEFGSSEQFSYFGRCVELLGLLLLDQGGELSFQQAA